MVSNEQLISRFYSAFSRLDAAAMQDCYANDPIFNDPVFGIIQGDAVKSMWAMLCERAKDFSLEFSKVDADEEYGTCNWVARYTFTKTGRKVENRVKAHMRFRDGKIIEHTDEFDFYKWAKQALGIPGVLLGWSSYLKNKVRRQAHQSLDKYIATHPITNPPAAFN